MADDVKTNFFQTLPGVLTAIAALCTGIAALLGALYQAGLISNRDSTPQQESIHGKVPRFDNGATPYFIPPSDVNAGQQAQRRPFNPFLPPPSDANSAPQWQRQPFTPSQIQRQQDEIERERREIEALKAQGETE
jgi:hypothetical protein